ncbi:MAG: cation transporter [Thermoguttaceae bacterium]
MAVNLSLAANLVLAVARTGVGILGHSPALLADGINSTSDVVYLSIVRVFMRLVGKPPDREHPFGHRIGLYPMLDVTLGIDGTLSVCEGDRIADRAEQALRENFEYLRQVSIHYHPSRRKG